MTTPLFTLRTDDQGRVSTPAVEELSNAELDTLNSLLPWQCFTLDKAGRRFGKQASAIKRNAPQSIPDRRIVELNRRIPLKGLHVLEVGCFEAIHTVALVDHGAKVTAIDSRIENVIKTLTRLWGFCAEADVLLCDVELDADFARMPCVDVTHHVGVLYHLVDPVKHLRAVMARTSRAIMLDTHYATVEQANRIYTVEGKAVPYKYFKESGRSAAFAGMYDHAKWLTLDTLTELLKDGGFGQVEVAERREERNGHRALIYAIRA